MTDSADGSNNSRNDGSLTARLPQRRQSLIEDTSSPEPKIVAGTYRTKRTPDSDNLDDSGKGDHAADVESRRGKRGLNRFK